MTPLSLDATHLVSTNVIPNTNAAGCGYDYATICYNSSQHRNVISRTKTFLGHSNLQSTTTFYKVIQIYRQLLPWFVDMQYICVLRANCRYVDT
jgi:hypothetical protein